MVGKSSLLGSSLKCWYTKACSVKGGVVCSYRDRVWLGSWTCGMWLRQAGIAKRGKPFCVSEQWECREPCLRVGKELVRIRGWTNGRDIMVEKGKAKSHQELSLLREKQTSRKGCCRCRQSRRKVCWQGQEVWRQRSWNKLWYLMSSSPWSLLLSPAFSNLWCPRDQRGKPEA